MSRRRFTTGGITVSMAGWDEAVDAMLTAAQKATVDELERFGDERATDAEQRWYGPDGVTRRTGRSGQIERSTTFNADRAEVRVTIGSTDTRVDPQKRKPTALFVRRPGPLSVVRRKVTQGEWWAWKKAGRPVAPRIRGNPPWLIEEPNPKASDGKYLIVEFVRKPVNQSLKVLAGRLGDRIAARMKRGG